MSVRLAIFSLMAALVVAAHPARAAPRLTVADGQFHLTTEDGRELASRDLVGAVFEMQNEAGVATVRIDAVTPDKDRAQVLLHEMSIRDAVSGAWVPFCEADAYGRKAGLPVEGRWDDQGYRKAPGHWFLACTSGAQVKCVLWGYDPARPGPHGEDLGPYYEACTHMVRADYDGRGEPYTRNGTIIDMWDDLGIQVRDPKSGPDYRFEAGWAPKGAVCVARTRWASLLPLDILLESQPRLGGQCDEAAARGKGALIFNMSR